MYAISTSLSRRRPAARRLSGGGRSVLLALCLTLTGCASLAPTPQESGSIVAGGQQGRALDANLSGFLAQSAPGAVVTLAKSPWGANVTIIGGAPYHAASGRSCRRLTIEGGRRGETHHAVACESPDGWKSRRLVTQPAGGQ